MTIYIKAINFDGGTTLLIILFLLLLLLWWRYNRK
ncbi:GlyGly-CTERM sorting domain-containing protein [Fusobacterium polymorphum]